MDSQYISHPLGHALTYPQKIMSSTNTEAPSLGSLLNTHPFTSLNGQYVLFSQSLNQHSLPTDLGEVPSELGSDLRKPLF